MTEQAEQWDEPEEAKVAPTWETWLVLLLAAVIVAAAAVVIWVGG